MKCFSVCTLFFCVLSLCAAIPVPTDDGKPPVDKGKGRAVDPPSPPPSHPHTPTPEQDSSVPLPGRTGMHTDPHTDVVTMHYGDDNLHEHMGHLQRNQAAFPHNRNPNPLSVKSERNRPHALHNIPAAGKHPVTGLEMVRDEKLPQMLHNPHHSTSTTVEYLPAAESYIEGGHIKSFRKKIEKVGPNAQGQIRPNPGWVPLHPGQRRGHEAPARLNTQHHADGTHFTEPSKQVPNLPKKAAMKRSDAKSDSKHASLSKSTESYTPAEVGPNKMNLRERIGKPAPLPQPLKVHRPTPAPGASNLRPGHVAPHRHVWHPSGDGSRRATHFGAPGHLQGAEQRHPPRPQNHEHYMKQLHAGREAEVKHKTGAASGSNGPAKYRPAQTLATNLQMFEQQFGPARHPGTTGRTHEAPARMQTHANHPLSHSAPQTRPSIPHGHQPRPAGPHGHQSRPSSPHPHTPSHNSQSKGGPSRRK